MPTSFPGSLDVLANPAPTDKTNVFDHAGSHSDANDAIEALEAKVGADGSAVTTSHDYKLSAVTGADKAVTSADARLTDARDPLAHIHSISEITDLTDTLTAKAPSDSPAFIGTPTGITKAHVGLGSVDNTADSAKPVSTAQQTALNLKANLASPTFTGTVVVPDASFALAKLANMATASLYYRRTAGSGAPEVNTLAQLKTDLVLVKADVGLGSVDNTADTAKPISTATQTALAAILSGYRTLLNVSGSHTAAKVAGTYAFGHGDVLAVTGTGTLYPLATIYIAAADYPTAAGLAAKLRVRAQLYTNDVAPFTGTFIVSLHPITRPGTSGGAGVCIFTVGAAVAGSGLTFTNPAADSLLNGVGADFALPADGHYVIAAVTNQTMAASAHAHLSASLQLRNA